MKYEVLADSSFTFSGESTGSMDDSSEYSVQRSDRQLLDPRTKTTYKFGDIHFNSRSPETRRSNSSPERGDYVRLKSQARSPPLHSEIWFDHINPGTGMMYAKKPLPGKIRTVTDTVMYWHGSTIPTDRSRTYYVKKMQCYFFSERLQRIYKRSTLAIDDRTHRDIVDYYEAILEHYSWSSIFSRWIRLDFS